MINKRKLFGLVLSLGLMSTTVACSTENDTHSTENEKAIEQNEGKKEDTSKKDSEDKVKEDSNSTEANEEYQADVVVVGGGGAGLVSALSAAENDARVILLEKQAAYGGATSMSSGKIPAVNTKEQEEAGIEDSVDAMMRDINRAGDYTQNQDLLRVATENASSVKEWLEEQGIDWKLETDSIYYGQSTNRIHVAEGSGSGIVNTLEKNVEENPNIIGLKNMNATGILTEDGKVSGVVVEKDGKNITFKAQKVILATSGFGANKEMIERYTPSIAKGVANVAPGATGDGILWGIDLGADVSAMNAYQGYAPISYETHKSLGSAFLDNGGILINNKGERFINEYVGYSPLATAIVNQPEAYAYMVWDKNIHDLDIPALANIGEDELVEAKTIDELAEKLSIDKDALNKEYERYKEGIKTGEDYLNRTKLPESFEGPFYAVKVTGDYRHTQGGLVINPDTAEVLDKERNPIENLYAAGGVTEGFSSNGSNAYMAGNGLLQAFVYGRIAGLHTAYSLDENIDNDTFNGQKEKLEKISKSVDEENLVVSDTEYKDGEYEGTGSGHGGDIKVKVLVKDGKIANVEILDHKETEGISDPAIETLPELITKANNPEIDTISGATNTSKGIIEAVNQALEEAK